MNFSGSALIIDDDDAFSEVVEGFLRAAGYDAAVARNGFQALKLAREIKPDIILCDMKMPQMAGADVLRELASDPATARIPRILMTGYADADRSHADAFLLKPFQAADVLVVVQRALATVPQRRSSRASAFASAEEPYIAWAG